MSDMELVIDDGVQRALIFRALNSEVNLLKRLYQTKDGVYRPPSIKHQVDLLEEVMEGKLYPELFFDLREEEQRRLAGEEESLLHDMMIAGDTVD